MSWKPNGKKTKTKSKIKVKKSDKKMNKLRCPIPGRKITIRQMWLWFKGITVMGFSASMVQLGSCGPPFWAEHRGNNKVAPFEGGRSLVECGRWQAETARQLMFWLDLWWKLATDAGHPMSTQDRSSPNFMLFMEGSAKPLNLPIESESRGLKYIHKHRWWQLAPPGFKRPP